MVTQITRKTQRGEGVAPGCPFCDRIAAGEYDFSDDHAVAFEPLNPVTGGHLLVVPRKHVANAGANPLAASRAMHLAAQLVGPLEWAGSYNLITSAGAAATQTVPHLHIHVIPRREGDGLALPWTGEPKCGYCYCPLSEAPECTAACAHGDRGYRGCGSRMVKS